MRRTTDYKNDNGSQRLMVRGGLLVAGVLALGALTGLADRARAANDTGGAFGGVGAGELRAVLDSLDSVEGQLTVNRMALSRLEAVVDYSATYQIPADLSAAIYDIALSEGIDPAVGFRLVQIESGFNARARSKVGAIGYTQLMPATASFYMSGLGAKDLYDRDINLRLGFRFLHELMGRFDNNLHYALLAYNRGPTTVREILAQGGNPANGYAAKIIGK